MMGTLGLLARLNREREKLQKEVVVHKTEWCRGNQWWEPRTYGCQKYHRDIKKNCPYSFSCKERRPRREKQYAIRLTLGAKEEKKDISEGS